MSIQNQIESKKKETENFVRKDAELTRDIMRLRQAQLQEQERLLVKLEADKQRFQQEQDRERNQFEDKQNQEISRLEDKLKKIREVTKYNEEEINRLEKEQIKLDSRAK